MDRYERILALHRSLKTARYPVSIKGLMEELACSRATLYRDIAFLRDALGAPIESEGEGSIRYDEKEAERFELPGLWLNSDELHALLAAGLSVRDGKLPVVAATINFDRETP